MEILIDTINDSICAVALNKNHSLEAVELDPEFEQIRHGTIYMGRVERIDATDNTAYIDLGHGLIGYLNAKDARHLGKKTDKPLPKWLNAGDLIIVQAQDGFISPRIGTYEQYEDKNVRLTMDLTLHGRFMLYAPYRKDNKISKRIKDKALNAQLLEMMDSENMHGVILRAASKMIQNDMLIREYKMLAHAWQAILNNIPMENTTGPILAGPDAIMRMLSNQAMNTIERVEICGDDLFDHTQTWCMQFAPDLVSKIIHSSIDENAIDAERLFEFRGVLTPIEDLYRPYAVLDNGASIIIEETAALTAIDVNRGGARGSKLNINISTAKEIMRQIRLRNLSGIIMIDFLKMANDAERKELTQAMKKFAADDPYTVQIHGLTKLGLMEVSRARRTPPLSEKLDSAINL
ncbi:MAG: ribonuclease E/G [Pseudomonadota bacterium]|jgi:Rne/Rng family ribonuclease|nr:ribonuclease E/G [Pseudomonadota bacterium]